MTISTVNNQEFWVLSASGINSFNQIPVFCEHDTWVWHFVKASLDERKLDFVCIPGSASMRESWHRFKNAPRIIVHWEAETRSGGALLEEILDTDPGFNIAQKVIILTSAPIHEDIVYFSELGVRRVVRIRHKEANLKLAAKDVYHHLDNDFNHVPTEVSWQKLQLMLDLLPKGEAKGEYAEKLQAVLKKLNPSGKRSARQLDAEGVLAWKSGAGDKAEALWLQALAINASYYRTYNNLIAYYRETKRYQKALTLLQKMYHLNSAKINRLVDIGLCYKELKNHTKAESFLKRALARDSGNSLALNGLAEIRFHKGEYEEARHLLSKTKVAYRFAAHLNQTGVDMVRENKFEEALHHYTNAQYVLPQRDKQPQLLYNIGLCYSRWGKFDMAVEFLRLALVKDPNYEKARNLLTRIESLSKSNEKTAVGT